MTRSHVLDKKIFRKGDLITFSAFCFRVPFSPHTRLFRLACTTVVKTFFVNACMHSWHFILKTVEKGES